MRAPPTASEQGTLQQSTIANEYEYTRAVTRVMAIGLNSSKLSLAAPPPQSPFVLPSSPIRFGQHTKMRQRESLCPSYSICASTASA